MKDDPAIMEKAYLDKRNKVMSIQILRIIACMGVYNGHFLGLTLPTDASLLFLSRLRNGWPSRTPFCMLWQGDTNVVLFYVVSGFMLMYSIYFLNNTVHILLKLYSRIVNLLFPTVIVTLLCALSWKLQEHIGIGTVHFDKLELKGDLFEIFRGGIPYYSYQLWYISSLLRFYTYGICFWCILRKCRKLGGGVLWIGVLLVTLNRSGYFTFLLGMLTAYILIVKRDIIDDRYRWRYRAGITAMFIIFPFLYNEDHLNIENKSVLGICFAGIILGLYCLEKLGYFLLSEKSKKIINFLADNSYSFYLIHVLVQKTFSTNFYIFVEKYVANSIILIFTDWVMTLIITWGLAHVFNRYVINGLNRLLVKNFVVKRLGNSKLKWRGL